jgi:large subunit ribosomal protein L10
MPTQAKIDVVADLTKRFEEASNFYITNYMGLNVEKVTKLRKDLRDNQIKFVVAKNTLLRKAAKEAGYDNILDYLKGPTAIAFSSVEPNVPAKILYDSYKESERPEVRAFFIDDFLYPGDEIKRIADLPGRDQLLSLLVAAIEGPIVNLVGTFDGIIREFVGTLDALAREKGK